MKARAEAAKYRNELRGRRRRGAQGRGIEGMKRAVRKTEFGTAQEKRGGGLASKRSGFTSSSRCEERADRAQKKYRIRHPPFLPLSPPIWALRGWRERERNRCCREVSRACEEVIKWTGAVRKTTAQFNRARAHLRASAAETITRTRYNLRSGDYINGRRRSGARAQGAQNAPRACLPIACAILPAQSARERQAAWLRERLWLWL